MADDAVKKIPVTSASTTDTTAVKTAPSDDTVDPFADIKNELATRFTLLPEDLQKVIVDDGYQLKLYEIAKAQKLTYEELGELELETTMVLLGMTKPEEYRDELQVQLKKNDPEIDAVVKAVNEQVFTPIRGALERLYAAKKDVPEGDFTDKAEYEPILAAAAADNAAAQNAPVKTAAVSPLPTMALSKEDTTVLAKTGVVISETKTPVPTMPVSSMPSRNDILKGIENPPKVPTPIIVAEKPIAAAPMITPTKTTDYSVTKAPTPAPAVLTPVTPAASSTPTPPRASDPYREPIN